MQSGLVSISFRKRSCEQIINACVYAGISYIEWGSDIHAPVSDHAALVCLDAIQREKGIVCASYGTYFRVGKDAPNDIRPYIEAAKILGTDVLRIWCGTKDSCLYTEKEAQEIIAQCRALAQIAQQSDVILCTEYHPGSFTDCKESTLSLLQTVDSPNFRTYWQPNQFVSFSENLESVKVLAPYIENIHVFNWTQTERFPLADGAARWQQYLAAVPHAKCAMLEFVPDGMLETLSREAAVLQAWIRTIGGE